MPHDPDPLPQRARRLALAFACVTGLTYGLIVLGALVRAHGAGLACPDWPLCFGELVPRFDVRVAFEWGHRVLAGSISLLFVAASALALHDPGLRPVVRNRIALTAGLLALQILLGALTVWHLLASWTVTSHLLTGNAFALGLAFVTRALFETASPRPPRAVPAPGTRAALAVAAALLALQMVLGGLVASRYSGLACTEWPTCNDGVWFPGFTGALGIHLLHRMVAYALVLAIATCAWCGRTSAGLAPLLRLALGIVLAQVAVGVANVLLRLPVEITGLHSALAAGLALTLALAVAEAFDAGRERA